MLSETHAPDTGDTRHLSVLLVEEDPGDALLLQHALPCDEFHVRHVGHLAEARTRLETERYDLMLLDWSRVPVSGELAVRHVLAQAAGTPVIVLMASPNEQHALLALRAGIQDCIVKGEVSAQVIRRTMRHAVERARIIAQLEDTRRRQLDEKQHVLDLVAHELRSPLHVARLALSMALDSRRLPTDCRTELALVDSNLLHVAGMIRDLLDTARMDHQTITVEPRSMDAGQLVRETVAVSRRVARERSVNMVTRIARDLPQALAEPARLQQVLTNLIDNALRFTAPGTEVQVRARRSTRAANRIEIAVRDHGPGVRAEGAARLFDRFYQDPSRQSRSGLGLGLFICRELIQRHGGDIWVENAAGGGARFAFTIPIA